MNVCIYKDKGVPITLRLDTFQWLTGFFGVFSFSALPFAAPLTGCHGGIVTNILSNGFHSPGGVAESCCCVGAFTVFWLKPSEGARGGEGVNAPSSRSLS
jgi:hypothetical protein